MQILNELIDLWKSPVKEVLDDLLIDKTTGNNIIFATRSYLEFGITEKNQITYQMLEKYGNEIVKPRALKETERQQFRTRAKAEVFTPSWLCNRMNNYCDTEWFGRKNIFNREKDHIWITRKSHIPFKSKAAWQRYVSSIRLEITCGEAPYIVSRYDASTGKMIPIKDRIGILDRKLRIVNENTKTEKEWLKWVYKAYRSVYGYEFQGDNLLIARVNLLITFADNMEYKFHRRPSLQEINKITNIIVWNFWQMDGITGKVPCIHSDDTRPFLSLLDSGLDENDAQDKYLDCKIYDWPKRKAITFNSIHETKS